MFSNKNLWIFSRRGSMGVKKILDKREYSTADAESTCLFKISFGLYVLTWQYIQFLNVVDGKVPSMNSMHI